MGNDYFLAWFPRNKRGGVTLCDEESIRSDCSIPDEESNLVVEVSWLPGRNFTRHEVTLRGAATVTAFLSGFPRSSVEE